MILDDKIIMFPPPPPYHTQQPPSPSSSSAHFSTAGHPRATLTSLPSHILLQIIHHTFPPLSPSAHTPQQQLYQDTKPERQRKTLFWLSTSLRLVSRQLYTACMHVLRSTYLPSYTMLIRPPYTSDPFPLRLPTSSSTTSGGGAQQELDQPTTGPPAYTRSTASRSTTSLTSLVQDSSPLLTIHRETPVLDRFIALKVRQDVFADDSELHIEREDAFRDLFDVDQPRARLEDLVRVYGVREGVVSLPGASKPRSTAAQAPGQGQERVYTSPSQSSSLVSLQSSKSPPTPHASSSSAHPPPPPPPKSRLSFFSFKKSPPSPSPSPSSPSPSSPHQSQFQKPQPPTLQQTQRQPPPPPQPHIEIRPIPFSALSVSFSPRRIGLVLNRSRTIAEVPRLGVGRNKEPLEVLARALVRELRGALGG